jgi:uncharacterized phage protein gp47/JayE
MAISDIISIDATGFHYADYPTTLEYFKDEYKAVYGVDTYLETDSQDGQMVAIFAKAFYDASAVFASVFTSFSPALAQGDALSRNVAINGITRLVPTYSTAEVDIIGTAGITITNGTMTDTAGYTWALDDVSITIPAEGIITGEACTCTTLGAIRAAPDSITRIATPTRGWLSVTNTAAATAGSPVETDAELRYRQALATMTSAIGAKGAIDSALAAPDVGCTDYKVYDNDSSIPDGNGIPAKTICVVVVGGVDQDVVDAIGSTKTLGCGTFGDDAGNYTDENGNVTVINYTRAVADTVDADIYITPRGGWAATTEALIVAAITEYIDGLRIGDNVMVARMYPPALLYGTDQFGTFDLTAIRVGAPGSLTGHDYSVPFDKFAEVGTINVITG